MAGPPPGLGYGPFSSFPSTAATPSIWAAPPQPADTWPTPTPVAAPPQQAVTGQSSSPPSANPYFSAFVTGASAFAPTGGTKTELTPTEAVALAVQGYTDSKGNMTYLDNKPGRRARRYKARYRAAELTPQQERQREAMLVAKERQQETLLVELRGRERLLKQTCGPEAAEAAPEKEDDTGFKSFLAQQYNTSGLALL